MIEIMFVASLKKKILTHGFGYLIKNALQTQFLKHFLPRRMDRSRSEKTSDERQSTRVRLSVASRPTSSRRARGTSFMNDELIWDVTRAVDS